MNTTSKLMGVVQGRATSALADALGNLIKSTYITNVTWDSSTHTLAFWGGSVLKYSCVIELAPQPLIDDPTKPLYLLSKQNGSTVTLGAVGTVGNTYQTSTDNVTWADYTLGTPITLNSGEGVYFRCTAFNTQFSYGAYVHFVMTGLIEAYHNINSMLSQSFDSLYDLSSLTYGGWCLNSLFEKCASLTKAPLLPATTLSEGCYDAMFYFTTSGQPQLVQPPTLPATTLASQCYALMFQGCTSLTQAPSLPATTLADRCYYRMFYNCSSLTQAPALPATTLVDRCYNSMFQGCSSLNEVRIAATDISASSCLGNWLFGVSSTGNFYCEPGVLYPVGASGIPTNWVRHDIPAIEDDPTKPLYLLSKQNGSTVTLSGNGATAYTDIYQTSTDNVTWADYTLGTPITLNSGEGVYFRIKAGKTQVFTQSQFVTFSTSTGVIEAYHNVNSMLSPKFSNLTDLTTVFGSGQYCLGSLFGPYEGTAPYLTKAPLLPATVLSDGCYYNMFFGCTSLTQAPELQATTLAQLCYFYMFSECTSLTQAPELPAPILASMCYNSMFRGCSLLSEVRIAATDISASSCLGSWLYGVAETGNFYCVQGVSYPSGTSGIPTNWTRHNIT